VSAAAIRAAMATAENALIMTVPCHGPPNGPVFVADLSNQGRFRDVFSKAENGFVRPRLCFVPAGRTKQSLSPRRRFGAASGSLADSK
jgi:molybdopterin-guanine dinucleotide biosynthesis protein A